MKTFLTKSFYGKTFLMLILILSVTSISHASWVFNSFYTRGVNITVNSWNYTQSYLTGNTQFVQRGGGTHFVLVTLKNASTTALTAFTVQGYSNGLDYLGTIKYFPVISNNGVATLLIPNVTTQGQQWSIATIFYNPQNNSVGSANTTVVQYQARQNYVNKPIYVTVIGSNYFTPIGISPPWSNSPYYNFSVTPAPYIQSGAVFFSTNSLANTQFNITSSTGLVLLGRVNTSSLTAKRYALSGLNAFAFSAPFVSNGSVESKTTNMLFNGIPTFDNIGFEEYVSQQSQTAIITEGMNAVVCNAGVLGCAVILNSVNNATKQVEYIGTPVFQHVRNNLTIAYNSPQTNIFVLPAFTTNYTLQANVVCIGTCGINSNHTNQWLYALHITNVSFNFSYFSASNTPGFTNFGGTQVKYLLIKIPHYIGMGQFCQYISAKDNISPSFFGYINWALVNCTPNYLYIVVHTPTTSGFAFNGFYLLFNNTFGLKVGNGFSNSTTLKNWRFIRNSGLFTVNKTTMPDNTLPFLINFSTILTNKSKFTALNFIDGASRQGSYNISYNSILGTDISSILLGNGGNPMHQSTPVATWLYANYSSGGATSSINVTSAFGTFFCITRSGGNAGLWFVNASTTTFHGTNLCSRTAGTLATFNGMNSGINGSVEYLYGTGQVGNAYQIQNVTFPNRTTSLPNPVTLPTTNTPTGLLIITPINFSSNTLMANVPVFPGYNIPKGYLYGFGMLLFTLSSLALNHKANAEMGISFAIILIWIIGIFQAQVLVIAVILSISFIGIELVEKRRHA